MYPHFFVALSISVSMASVKRMYVGRLPTGGLSFEPQAILTVFLRS
jgi:hypothetical protein